MEPADRAATAPPTRSRIITWPRVLLVLAWVATLVVAARAALFVDRHETAIMRRLGRLETSGVIQTSLYNVRFERVPITIDGRYGAIAPLGNGVLFASRSGRMWYADSARSVRELALRVPIDVAAFDGDPYNDNTADKDHFAVKDLVTQPLGASVRILATHNSWDADRKCYALRVSMVEVPLERLLEGAAAEWRTVYETTPCQEVGLIGNGQRRPTIGQGGRLAALSDHEYLLTVGMFVSDAAMTTTPDLFKDPAASYGKTLRIDVRTGQARVFTTGHRNPQGLVVAPDSSVWLTEHMARGGDELNLLREGADYGFPHVSYGTSYGTLDWPIGNAPGRHEAYVKPVHAWVPSIGPSQMVVASGRAFPSWRGDILLASLPARSLFRLRVEEGRVIFVEPMPTIHRMRDLIETASGEFVILAEDGFLVYLSPVDTEGEDPTLIPRERGQIVASRCQGCHTFNDGGPNGIGPNLYGIIGKRIASQPGFAYSAALRGLEGRWTEESLAAFIARPSAVAPGTAMEVGFDLSDRQREDLFTYLRTLR